MAHLRARAPRESATFSEMGVERFVDTDSLDNLQTNGDTRPELAIPGIAERVKRAFSPDALQSVLDKIRERGLYAYDTSGPAQRFYQLNSVSVNWSYDDLDGVFPAAQLATGASIMLEASNSIAYRCSLSYQGRDSDRILVCYFMYETLMSQPVVRDGMVVGVE